MPLLPERLVPNPLRLCGWHRERGRRQTAACARKKMEPALRRSGVAATIPPRRAC